MTGSRQSGPVQNVTLPGTAPRMPPMVRTMTVESSASIEGGLDEPTELEPEQGTLPWLARGPAHAVRLGGRDRGGAAQGAAAERRRPRRPGLAKLTRPPWTASRSPPLGTAASLDDLRPAGGPPARASGTSAPTSCVGDAEALNEDALVDLDGGVTSLWLAGRAAGRPRPCSGRAARPRAGRPRRHRRPGRRRAGLPGVLGDTTPTPGTNLGGSGDALVDVARLARDRGSSASSSTPPRFTTAAPPTRRSSAARWPLAATTCAGSPRPGIDLDEAAAPGGVPLRRDRRAVRRPSPSCGPPAGSGRACSS